MRTIVYVDGYKLYYGRLKHSPYKCLDIHTLFTEYILKQQNPSTELLCIKFYTAQIKANFASRGQIAMEAQRRYHRALESPRTGQVEIIPGYYDVKEDKPLEYLNPPNKLKRVNAWKIEEKQSDVNIALDMYRDAATHVCEQLVLCSGDTDLAPVFKHLENDFPELRRGLVLPREPGSHRSIPASLDKNAHWTRKHIRDDELEKSQFPDRVATRKKPLDRPTYW